MAADPRGRPGRPASTGRRLLGWLAPYRLVLAAGIAAAATASALDGVTLLFLIPLFRALFGTAGVLEPGASGLEGLIDRLLGPFIAGVDPGTATIRLVALLWAALILKNALAYLAGQLSVHAQEGLVRDLRAALFGHLLQLDLGWLERTRGGQVIARVMQDADQAKVAVSAGLASFFQNLVVVVVTLAVLASLSGRLTLLTLAAAPVLIIGIRLLLRRLRRYARERAHEAGEMTSTVSERLAAVKLIRTYGGEERERARFAGQADRYRRQVERTQRFAALTGPASEVFAGLLLVLLIAAGASPAFMADTLSPQELLVFIAAALRVMAPLKSLSQFPVQMAMGLASAERVFEVLDRPAAESYRDEGAAAKFEREVKFDRIGFEYGSQPPGRAAGFALSDISFTLPKGAVVALVGPSGAGKTTLAELLPRLREPTAGRILLDGVPMNELSRSSVRALMGFVGQETVIFNDTVQANIGYGLSSASEAAVEAAARAANAHDFIDALPERYQTRLGERGTRLSGGQRQRIAIARALLRDPPILVLDEATSALDTESERLVQEALNRLMQDRTVLVIAHRLATVRHADLILVLDRGCIVERGSHAELMDAGGLYARLCRPQTEWLGEAESRRLAVRA